jgi:transglutaminase-like putative cysteine protease
MGFMKYDEEYLPYLTPTTIIDCDHPAVQAFVWEAIETTADAVGRAVKLYLAVRDSIRYDPYVPFHRPEHYRASVVLHRRRGFCIPKASLLCACARAAGIPSRLGFATVRNHLATRQLLEYLGSDLFVYHAFTELYLGGKWVKATPAFNRELCERHGVPPLEFNGTEDSVFQPYNHENRKFMEYVGFLGSYADVPVSAILSAWEVVYGKERVRGWIEQFDAAHEAASDRFETEEIVIS